MIMTMLMVNIHEAKARLSEYLEAVARGERVLICKRNKPVAELTRVDEKRQRPRPVGAGPHRFTIPDSFFEPMPDEFLDAFENGPVVPGSDEKTAPRPRAGRRAPALLHRDPFDRMLVSQAIAHGLTIVTPDPLIAQYPVRTFW